MATYLPTHDALNVEVSCFTNYDTPANPVTINLLLWLRSTKHRTKIDALRSIEDKLERDAIKATLPAITPSGVFTYRQTSCLVAGSHTRLIQFDIDLKDNPHIRNYADLKAQIRKLPFVAYCALSASGKGYWGLVVIADPERHSQHFDALKRVFAHYRINIDTKPRNVASLRGYSYDAEPYFAEKVLVFELYDEPRPVAVREFAHSVDADTERQRVELCISEISKRGIDITSGYNYWYAIGCDLASTFGESGRDYFHVVSQIHPEYNPATCDKQYTHCLRSYKEVQLKAFFGRCRDNGVSWKELTPFRPTRQTDRTRPLNVKTSTRPTGETGKSTELGEFIQEQRIQDTVTKAGTEKVEVIVDNMNDWTATPGSILKPGESSLERWPVIEADYPANWDFPECQTATINIHPSDVTGSMVYPSRIAFPTAPLAFDAHEQLQRIRWCVIPPGVDEADYAPTLIPSPNRDTFARVLGMSADELPLFQLNADSPHGTL